MEVKKQPKIISIEGNIGSGKSTLIKNLKKKYNNNKICFLDEPLSIWESIKDMEGNSMLTKFYDNKQKYAFAFQMMVYISRISLLKQALKQNYDIIITERTIYSDKEVFAKMLYDDKKIEDVEYSIYLNWFNEFIQDIPPISYIYLKTDPLVANRRVLIRARNGENIPIEYLKACNDYHEKWLNAIETIDTKNPILILNANHDIVKNEYILFEWIEDIDKFINSL